jgi:hypothetical protein
VAQAWSEESGWKVLSWITERVRGGEREGASAAVVDSVRVDITETEMYINPMLRKKAVPKSVGQLAHERHQAAEF